MDVDNEGEERCKSYSSVSLFMSEYETDIIDAIGSISSFPRPFRRRVTGPDAGGVQTQKNSKRKRRLNGHMQTQRNESNKTD